MWSSDYVDFRCSVDKTPFGMQVTARPQRLPIVDFIAEKSPAEAAGVKVGDFLIEVAGRTVDSSSWFVSMRQAVPPFGLRFRRAATDSVISTSILPSIDGEVGETEGTDTAHEPETEDGLDADGTSKDLLEDAAEGETAISPSSDDRQEHEDVIRTPSTAQTAMVETTASSVAERQEVADSGSDSKQVVPAALRGSHEAAVVASASENDNTGIDNTETTPATETASAANKEAKMAQPTASPNAGVSDSESIDNSDVAQSI